MKANELNDFLKENNIKILNLYYKYDENGKRYLEDEPMTAAKLAIHSGWYQLIHDLISKLLETNWNKLATQVKEKFGGLRFYIDEGSDEIYNIINEHEQLSYFICERCGEKGSLRRDIGWWRTLCDNHYNELKNK